MIDGKPRSIIPAKRFRFDRTYFLIAAAIFLTETLIALFVHDGLIRPYLGDALVVILIYCFLRTFLDIGMWLTAMLVLLFSFTIELLQYLHFVERLNLERSKLACVLLGNSFSWEDILAYASGIIVVILIERQPRQRSG